MWVANSTLPTKRESTTCVLGFASYPLAKSLAVQVTNSIVLHDIQSEEQSYMMIMLYCELSMSNKLYTIFVLVFTKFLT